jgi:single-strand DNA-binding protein
MSAEGLNLVLLTGNLGAEPELRHTSGGQAVLNLRVATTESYEQNGERKERTEWHAVCLWGKRAEGLARILRKGETIVVQGSLRTSKYEAKGETRYKTEIVASNVILTSKKNESGGGGGFGKRPTPNNEDDIPFVTSEPGARGL